MRCTAVTLYTRTPAPCLLQIGELAGKLSEALIAANPDIPWRGIKAERNIIAHAYGDVDLEVTWNTMHEDIPMLKDKCTSILARMPE